MNNKDGLKTWLSDDNTKEDGVERRSRKREKTVEALRTSHSGDCWVEGAAGTATMLERNGFDQKKKIQRATLFTA